MKKIAILLLIIILPFSAFIWYRLNVVKWVRLSEYWSLTSHTEGGYLLYSTQDRRLEDFDYINLDELFVDKYTNILYLKNNFPNQPVYYYQKINLNKYEVSKVNPDDTIYINNKEYIISDLDFISPWRIIVFNP
jgi:hypothetical protein